MREFFVQTSNRSEAIKADSLKEAVNIFEKKYPYENVISVIENIVSIINSILELFGLSDSQKTKEKEIKKR